MLALTGSIHVHMTYTCSTKAFGGTRTTVKICGFVRLGWTIASIGPSTWAAVHDSIALAIKQGNIAYADGKFFKLDDIRRGIALGTSHTRMPRINIPPRREEHVGV